MTDLSNISFQHFIIQIVYHRSPVTPRGLSRMEITALMMQRKCTRRPALVNQKRLSKQGPSYSQEPIKTYQEPCRIPPMNQTKVDKNLEINHPSEAKHRETNKQQTKPETKTTHPQYPTYYSLPRSLPYPSFSPSPPPFPPPPAREQTSDRVMKVTDYTNLI